jgi:hypothetical protein
MSIRNAINNLDGRELFCLPSMFPGDETPRTVYASIEIAELVMWREPDDTREGRMAFNARGLLDDFVEGAFITIAEDPFDKDAKCILARVDPVAHEFWDFRCLDPNPGLRILGGFSELDTFIALTWDYRENFDGNWERKVSECGDEWRRLFKDIPPHGGKSLNEYVSYNFRAV